MCYHAESGRSALTSVGRHENRTPKIDEHWNSVILLECEPGVTDPKIHVSPRHVSPHHVKFGGSATKNVHMNKMDPQNWRALRLHPSI